MRRAEMDAYLQKKAGQRMAGAALLIGAVLSLSTGYFISHRGTTMLQERIHSVDFNLQHVKKPKDAQGRALPPAYLGGKKFEIETTEPNEVLFVELEQEPGRTPANRTRNVTVELLEMQATESGKTGEKPIYAAMPNEPFVFEGGSGRNLDFRFHMTVKEAKKYGLLLRVSDDQPQWGPLNVSVQSVGASALPFYWGGVAMILIGLVFTWVGRV